MRSWSSLVLLGLSLFPTVAGAAPADVPPSQREAKRPAPAQRPPHGAQLDLGVGYAMPFGDLRPGLPLERFAPWAVAVELGGGYAWDNGWSFLVGLPMLAGAADNTDFCAVLNGATKDTCSLFGIRFVLQAQYHFPSLGVLGAPQLGVEAGWDLLYQSAGGDSELTNLLHGPGLGVRLVDYFEPVRGLRFGPYVAFRPSRYPWQSISCTGCNLTNEAGQAVGDHVSRDVPDPRWHSMLSFGIQMEAIIER